MRPLHLLVAVIVLAAAGVAWLLFNPGKDGDAVSSALPHSSKAAPEAAKAKAQLDAVEPASGSASESERVAIDSKPAAAPAAKGATSKSGDLVVVSGEVHDASGKPVNGAKVLAVCGRDGFTGDLPLDVEMPRFGPQRTARLEATTDAAGRFELANARPGSLQLAVRGAGQAPYDARNINVPSGERHDLGVITLEAGVTLEGRVVDSRGRALVGARIQRLPEQRSSFFFFDGNRRPGVTFATTRGDGTFSTDQLPSGPVALRVLSDDHPDKSESLTSSRPGERLPNMTIVLDDGFEISGRVVGAPPEKVGSLRVNASPSRAGQEEESDQGAAFEFPAAAGETRTAQCDSSGNFTVRGLRDGKRYGLRAVRDSEDGDFFGGGVSPRVTARSGDRGVELAYRPESALVFDVVDARTQEPIEEFTAEAGIEWREPFGARDGQSARKHPGGHLRFEGLRAKSADDLASLEINAVGYAKFLREDIELKPGADTDLGVIELQPVPVTRVTVLDGATGAPLAGARVTLRKVPEPEPANSGGGFRARAMSVALSSDSTEEPADFAGFGDEDSVRGKTDEHGVATLTSFEGVRCTLDVTHGEHAPHRSDEFTCAKGTPEERTVRMQRGGAVRVTLVDSEGVAVAGGRVEHRAPDSEPGSFMFGPESNAKDVTNAEGVVVFSHLAPGTHRFRPRGAGGPAGFIEGGNFSLHVAGMPDDQPRDTSWSEVIVADDATSELKLVAPKQVALTGLVRESGTPLSGAKLSLRARAKDGERDGMPMFFGGGPQAKTDGHGHYDFANVKAGEYTLTVDHATRQMSSELNVTVGESDTTFNVDLSVATIEGRVTGADNKPLAGVRMSVERSLGDGAPRPSGSRVMVMRGNDGDGTVSFGDDGGADKPALTDADGRYFLRGVLTDVDIVVKAQAKGYQAGKTEAFKLHANDARSGVDLSLKSAGRIEVSAFKADGTPASMVFVTARPEDPEQADSERKQGFIQESGKTTLDGLSPGKWRVSARSMGPNPRDGAGSPAEQVVEIEVDKPASVRFDMP